MKARKLVVLFLALVLALSLAAPAMAAWGPVVLLSPQALRVNGQTRSCEKYNIDNYNYFMLRDLAMLLNGTANQFDVDYDEATATMIVTTHKPYTHATGLELRSGVDNSWSAIRTNQKLRVDGKLKTGLKVYNLGGHNFFQLRELGAIIGFNVDWEEDSNTAVVTSTDYVPATRLPETADAGRSYLDKIIFLGDSTTYGLGVYYNLGYYDLVPFRQVWTPKVGYMLLSNWSVSLIVYRNAYGGQEEIKIEKAVRRAKPEYMVITLGADGISYMDKDWFIRDYTALVRTIQAASPDTKIILNSIYPVARSYKYQGDINNTKIRNANGWIEQIARDTGCRYLNSFDAVVGYDGYLPETSQNGDGIHLTGEAFGKVMRYIRTHRYQ